MFKQLNFTKFPDDELLTDKECVRFLKSKLRLFKNGHGETFHKIKHGFKWQDVFLRKDIPSGRPLLSYTRRVWEDRSELETHTEVVLSFAKDKAKSVDDIYVKNLDIKELLELTEAREIIEKYENRKKQ